MKFKFKPTLATIEEEQNIPETIIHKMEALFLDKSNKSTIYYGERLKKWDSKVYRDKLQGPHHYQKKQSRHDPNTRYSYDRSSAGLWEFIAQQRKKYIPNVKSTQEKLIEKHAVYQKIILSKKQTHQKPSSVMPMNYVNESHKIWEQWASPKRIMSVSETEYLYGARVKRWDSIHHKNDILEKAKKPVSYVFRHAKNDKSRRFSYENSSEGLRDFINARRLNNKKS